MSLSPQDTLLDAWKQSAQNPELLHETMDCMLRDETLGPVMISVQDTLDPLGFAALLAAAFGRAEQITKKHESSDRVSVLIACPLMGDPRDFPVCTSEFWDRLTHFVTKIWSPGRPADIEITPLGVPVLPSAIAYLNIQGWHGLLRDATAMPPTHAVLNHLRILDDQLAVDPPIPPFYGAQVLTQRVQMARLSYDSSAFSAPPHMLQFFEAALSDANLWQTITGPLPPYGQLIPPQRLRGALTVALHHYLETMVTVSLIRRQRPRQGFVEWLNGPATAKTFTLLPRHNGEELDPITLRGQWLYVVGGSLINEVLGRLTEDFKRYAGVSVPMAG